jgi:peptide/nickel transport system substrate-binding protein
MKWILGLLLVLLFITEVRAEPVHAIAMHGQPKYPRDFANFAYVNPEAPKGGEIKFAITGNFDSLNPFIVMGSSAPGIRKYVFESLMTRSADEPFSLYGLLAKTMETPPDRNWVEFTLNENAIFSDGKPVSVADVIFSHQILRDKGRPNHRFYYSKITKVEQKGERTVRFTFNSDGDREMPLIMGLMPILPAHFFKDRKFDATTLEPLVGSGPYAIEKVAPGKSISFKRNLHYWGDALAVNRGRYNFDRVSFEFYRDDSALFEAFKKGLYSLREENDPGRWAAGYNFPAVKNGRVVTDPISLRTPSGMRGLVFNTRRAIFSDIRVRKALGLLLDFEWINKNLYHGLYTRTASFFDRSELSSSNRPVSARERQWLAEFPGVVDADILAAGYLPPTSDGSGRDRHNRRKALKLLQAAGYVLKKGKLINEKSRQPFEFEILATNRSQERLLLWFARSLRSIGITARLRIVDSAQYQRRKKTYDFDMLQNTWYASLSPGNEQSFRWSAKAAATDGTFNYPGVRQPAVDAMIDHMLQARDRAEFVDAVRALDRVLLAGHYVIPLFHRDEQWIARATTITPPRLAPASRPVYGAQYDTWWHSK